MKERKNTIQAILIAVIILFFVTFSSIIELTSDFLWFDALGHLNVFKTTLGAKIGIFAVAGLIFFVFAMLNLALSTLFNKSKKKSNDSPKGLPIKTKFLIVSIISFIVGITTSSQWSVILRYLNRGVFNVVDPIFSKDVAFYVFELPFYDILWKFAFATVLITAVAVFFDYFQTLISTAIKAPKVEVSYGSGQQVPKYSFDFKNALASLKKKASVHIAFLGSLLFVLLAVRHYLSMFSIMYSRKGIVVGAGYVDVAISLPILKILMFLAIGISVLFLVWVIFSSGNKGLKKRHFLVYAIIIYLIFGFIGPTAIPGVVQSLKVSPNEINLEKPFIENNIKFTRLAYGLDKVVATDFPVDMKLTADLIEQEASTIDNARILDWRPLRSTYEQMQEIRPYYSLQGIDLDRYMINGKLTQIMIAPREMEQNQLAENAKTWVNLHTVYTHGYGIVMSPVNKVTDQGLPDYFIKDIPPKVMIDSPGLEVERPQVYYGEKENSFVITNTKTEEFDYPKGDTNEGINYDGLGGITLDSFGKKLLMAFKFRDFKILLNEDITTASKMMFDRSIKKRISKIAPFLLLDEDPYLVLDNGRLYWIMDAYTATSNYPYSELTGLKGQFGNYWINYLRNPVKIVVDAYHGSVDFYVVDESEPILASYRNIFPDMFKPLSAMPEGLKSHIRYPEDMFKIQTNIYNTYHMDDATVFYNKEDAWEIPDEIQETNRQMKVEPYFIIMKLPNSDKEEFILMTPFTPIKKNNMIAWMAARMDTDNYGELVLYKFPKDKLIYGPMQIEARFDQDSEISQQLTLWSQQGSSVTRGNLLIIPIKDSLLYIEPLYIKADKGQLPELKRVLVSDGEKVVMEKDLKTSLEALFGKASTKIETDEFGEEVIVDLSNDELLIQASNYYLNIEEAMQDGDWAIMGENFDMLGDVLKQLELES